MQLHSFIPNSSMSLCTKHCWVRGAVVSPLPFLSFPCPCTFYLLQQGVLPLQSFSNFSSVDPPWATVPSGSIYMLQHNVPHRLQGNTRSTVVSLICSSGWSTFFPSFFNDFGVQQCCFSHFFFPYTSLLLYAAFSPFLKHILAEVPLPLLTEGSAVSCGAPVLELAGAALACPHRHHSQSTLLPISQLHPGRSTLTPSIKYTFITHSSQTSLMPMKKIPNQNDITPKN